MFIVLQGSTKNVIEEPGNPQAPEQPRQTVKFGKEPKTTEEKVNQAFDMLKMALKVK